MTATRTASASRTQRMIAEAVAALERADIENCRLDAEVMLAEAAGSTRTAVISGLAMIDAQTWRRYATMIKRRVCREPLAYILGRKEFYSLEFGVSPAVLIPRPETETLVSAALELIATCPMARVLDLGTGSGAIAVAIAVNAGAVRIVATDNSPAALEVTARNVRRLEVGARVQLRLADCFEAADNCGPLGRFDLIVANPPYVKEGDIGRLEPEVSRYEPRNALAGGRDGLDFYRRLATGLRSHLKENAAVVLEIGSDQSGSVAEILRAHGARNIRVKADLAGLPRVITADF